MDDKEFIIWLVRLLWNDLADGDTPSDEEMDELRTELRRRDIDPDEVMPY